MTFECMHICKHACQSKVETHMLHAHMCFANTYYFSKFVYAIMHAIIDPRVCMDAPCMRPIKVGGYGCMPCTKMIETKTWRNRTWGVRYS